MLDKNIDKYLLRNENIKIIGPNVISLLEKYKDFYQFSKQLNEVRL
ncbi:MAG: hypothetical protein ACJ0G4_02350 [Alphaproteobacteria bacterium]